MKVLILLLLTLTACGGFFVPLRNYQSTTPSVSEIHTEKASVYLEHLGKKYNHLVFDLEIVNRSASSIFIKPGQIRYFVSFDSLPAVFPEKVQPKYARTSSEITKIYTKRSQGDESGPGFWSFLFAVGVSVADEALDQKDSRKENLTKVDKINSVARDVAVTVVVGAAESSAESRTPKSVEDLQYLPQELFKGGMIRPGQSMRGKIFLRSNYEFDYCRIVVPVRKEHHTFDFVNTRMLNKINRKQARKSSASSASMQ